MTYRKDIQILRGFAVLIVLLYHFGVPGFKNGFLGVDIFFVISGYLMATLYTPNNKKIFFKRRILRLFPAYFIIIIITLLLSIFILDPNEYRQAFVQANYASLFMSNIGFWYDASYFSKDHFNIFLHLWSLGVEVQFYLIMLAIVIQLKKIMH